MGSEESTREEVGCGGNVLRREEEYVGNRVIVMDVPGKRSRGRSKLRWLPGWITSRTTCWRENCEKRMRKPEFNGGVS